MRWRSAKRPTWTSLIAGIGYIRAHPAILGAISLDLFAVLLGGAASLMPIYARDILHTGPWGLGLLRSGPAIGAFIVGLTLAQVPIRHHAGHIVFGAVGTFGVMTIGFGLSTSLPLSMLFLIIMGGADMMSVFVRQSLVQIETPDVMRGRVAAVNTLFVGASNELGDFESGVVAAMIGAVPAVVVGGLGTIIVAGLWAWLFPALRKRDTIGGLSATLLCLLGSLERCRQRIKPSQAQIAMTDVSVKRFEIRLDFPLPVKSSHA